jgi:hypothetical protein
VDDWILRASAAAAGAVCLTSMRAFNADASRPMPSRLIMGSCSTFSTYSCACPAVDVPSVGRRGQFTALITASCTRSGPSPLPLRPATAGSPPALPQPARSKASRQAGQYAQHNHQDRRAKGEHLQVRVCCAHLAPNVKVNRLAQGAIPARPSVLHPPGRGLEARYGVHYRTAHRPVQYAAGCARRLLCTGWQLAVKVS